MARSNVRQDRRRDNLRALCAEFYIDLTGRPTSSSEEDVREFFENAGDPDFALGAWCAVTRGHGSNDEITYLYPTFWTMRDAKAKAVANIDNDIFAEAPVCIVNMDDPTRRLRPKWRSLTWQ